MPPSTTPPEVSRRIHDTMEALIGERKFLVDPDLIERIQAGRATVVDLDDVARLCHITVPDLFAMARKVRSRQVPG